MLPDLLKLFDAALATGTSVDLFEHRQPQATAALTTWARSKHLEQHVTVRMHESIGLYRVVQVESGRMRITLVRTPHAPSPEYPMPADEDAQP